MDSSEAFVLKLKELISRQGQSARFYIGVALGMEPALSTGSELLGNGPTNKQRWMPSEVRSILEALSVINPEAVYHSITNVRQTDESNFGIGVKQFLSDHWQWKPRLSTDLWSFEQLLTGSDLVFPEHLDPEALIERSISVEQMHRCLISPKHQAMVMALHRANVTFDPHTFESLLKRAHLYDDWLWAELIWLGRKHSDRSEDLERQWRHILLERLEMGDAQSATTAAYCLVSTRWQMPHLVPPPVSRAPKT